MTKANSSNRKEMIKEENVAYKGRETTERGEIQGNRIDYPSYEFFKLYLIIEINMVTLSGTQENNI